MHHIFHTKAFVLNSRNYGEADKMITFYTRELGLLKAVAKGIRLNKSKSRFALQDFSFANVDLVLGRNIWRVTSSSPINYFPYLKRNKKTLVLISRISKLLERLCTGEEANPEIFDTLIQTLILLDEENILNDKIESLELYLVLQIVYKLGYVGEGVDIESYLGEDFNQNKIKSFLENKKSIISHINKALKESHL